MAEINLMEWFEKAKADPKVAAQPVIAIVAILALGWKFGYAPVTVDMAKELKKNKGVQDQIKGLESAVANIEDIKITVAEMKKKWAEVESLCYKKNEAHKFLQDIRQIGRDVGLDIKNIAPQPTVPKTFESLMYEEYPIKIAFTGSFAQFGIFLRKLEKHPKITFMDFPPLVPDASGVLKLDLLPTTILISDQVVAPPPPPAGE